MNATPVDLLVELRDRRTLCWIGLMSGTSCDGIDVAQVEITEREVGAPAVRVLRGETVPFPETLARELRADLDGTASVERAARWDAHLGEAFGRAARRLLDRSDAGTGTGTDTGTGTGTSSGHPQPFRADAIALSGHTFVHRPTATPAVTLQLGDPARVARAGGCPVVAGFRACDVARGGEGAPLVPAADRILFGDPERHVAVLNIGGISNVTWLGAGEHTPRAADCGPGNLILDALVRAGSDDELCFDTGGALAADGNADGACVERWLTHPFFHGRRRSTGREEFGAAWVRQHGPDLASLSLPDQLATAVEWIARSVARCVERLAAGAPPDRLLVGGGGVHHRTLLDAIGRAVGCTAEPLTRARHGVDADLREAVAFALLGHEWLRGRPGSFPETTGCREAGPLGSLWLAHRENR